MSASQSGGKEAHGKGRDGSAEGKNPTLDFYLQNVNAQRKAVRVTPDPKRLCQQVDYGTPCSAVAEYSLNGNQLCGHHFLEEHDLLKMQGIDICIVGTASAGGQSGIEKVKAAFATATKEFVQNQKTESEKESNSEAQP